MISVDWHKNVKRKSQTNIIVLWTRTCACVFLVWYFSCPRPMNITFVIEIHQTIENAAIIHRDERALTDEAHIIISDMFALYNNNIYSLLWYWPMISSNCLQKFEFSSQFGPVKLKKREKRREWHEEKKSKNQRLPMSKI